eukprot:Nk52_evm1s781 gene=Nk52_evmTU1s781
MRKNSVSRPRRRTSGQNNRISSADYLRITLDPPSPPPEQQQSNSSSASSSVESLHTGGGHGRQVSESKYRRRGGGGGGRESGVGTWIVAVCVYGVTVLQLCKRHMTVLGSDPRYAGVRSVCWRLFRDLPFVMILLLTLLIYRKELHAQQERDLPACAAGGADESPRTTLHATMIDPWYARRLNREYWGWMEQEEGGEEEVFLGEHGGEDGGYMGEEEEEEGGEDAVQEDEVQEEAEVKKSKRGTKGPQRKTPPKDHHHRVCGVGYAQTIEYALHMAVQFPRFDFVVTVWSYVGKEEDTRTAKAHGGRGRGAWENGEEDRVFHVVSNLWVILSRDSTIQEGHLLALHAHMTHPGIFTPDEASSRNNTTVKTPCDYFFIVDEHLVWYPTESGVKSFLNSSEAAPVLETLVPTSEIPIEEAPTDDLLMDVIILRFLRLYNPAFVAFPWTRGDIWHEALRVHSYHYRRAVVQPLTGFENRCMIFHYSIAHLFDPPAPVWQTVKLPRRRYMKGNSQMDETENKVKFPFGTQTGQGRSRPVRNENERKSSAFLSNAAVGESKAKLKAQRNLYKGKEGRRADPPTPQRVTSVETELRPTRALITPGPLVQQAFQNFFLPFLLRGKGIRFNGVRFEDGPVDFGDDGEGYTSRESATGDLSGKSTQAARYSFIDKTNNRGGLTENTPEEHGSINTTFNDTKHAAPPHKRQLGRGRLIKLPPLHPHPDLEAGAFINYLNERFRCQQEGRQKRWGAALTLDEVTWTSPQRFEWRHNHGRGLFDPYRDALLFPVYDVIYANLRGVRERWSVSELERIDAFVLQAIDRMHYGDVDPCKLLV